MAKISDTQLQLLRPDFSDSNQLMNDGLKTLLESFKPVQTQMDANFAERQSNAAGSLLEQISQGMPQDYNNNPEARALFDNQISQFANENNLSREGVNLGDVYSILSKQAADRDKDRQLALTNKDLYSTQRREQLFNELTAGNINNEQYRDIVALEGLTKSSQEFSNLITGQNIDNSNAAILPAVGLFDSYNGKNREIESKVNQLELSNLASNGRELGRGLTGTNALGKLNALPQNSPSIGRASVAPYRNSISNAAKEYNVPESLISSILHYESTGRNNVVSSKGATGLMQIIPSTFNMLTQKGIGNGNINDPDNNIKVGTAYIGQLLDKYKQYGSKGIEYALMAYNWGPGNTDKYISGKIKNIPAETKKYLANIKGDINQSNNPHTGASYSSNPNVGTTNNPFFNPNDNKKLNGTDPRIAEILGEAAKNLGIKIGVSEGIRSQERQKEMVSKGKSQTLNSKHLHGGAVDFHIIDANGKTNWNFESYRPLANEAKKIAKSKGYTGFEWGGDWKTLKDGVHFQFNNSNTNNNNNSLNINNGLEVNELYNAISQPAISSEIVDRYTNITSKGNTGINKGREDLYNFIKNKLPNPITGETNTNYVSPEDLQGRNQHILANYESIDNHERRFNAHLSNFNNELSNDIQTRYAQSSTANDMLQQAILQAEQTGEVIDANAYITDKTDFSNYLESSGSSIEAFEDYDGDSQATIIGSYLDRQEKIEAGNRATVGYVDKLKSTTLNNYDSLSSQFPKYMNNRVKERRIKNAEKLADKPLIGKSDTEKYLNNLDTLENTVFNLISSEIENNKESYTNSATNTLVFSNTNKFMDSVMKNALYFYDKRIKEDTIDNPKVGIPYLSKNLTKGPIYKKELLSQAVQDALNHEANASRKVIAKNVAAKPVNNKSLTEVIRRADLANQRKSK